MFRNTKIIIDYFKVPFAIENPAYALSQYILKEYKREVVNYCQYGQDRKKPTAIYTNFAFKGKKCNHKRKHTMTHNTMNYKDRASVPPKLIRDIIECAKGEKNDN